MAAAVSRRSVLGQVTPVLAELGFKKRTGPVFTIDVAPGVLGCLGLNQATKHRPAGEVEVGPVVGVRFGEVERVVAECCGEPDQHYLPATVSCPLGYLMPERKFRAWVLGGGDGVVADMVRAISDYGVPFIRSVVDLGELRRLLTGGWGLAYQLVYTRPVAALLAGEPAQARAMVEEALATMAGRSDAAAVRYRRFAKSFRDRLPPALAP